MIDARLNYQDMIALESVESYMAKKGVRSSGYPVDAIVQESVFKNELYSKIAERMPKYAVYLLSVTDIDTDDAASGLLKAITQHVLHPEFIDILMKSLDERRDVEAGKVRAVVGALLVDVVMRYVNDKQKEIAVDDKKKKDGKPSAAEEELVQKTMPARQAAEVLLAGLKSEVKNTCAGLEDHDALIIAGCIAMGGTGAITKLVSMDVPVTAEVYEIIRFDSEVFNSIVKAALLLRKDKFTKLSANQKNFTESLKRWIYKTINDIENPQRIYQLLLSTYGSARPEHTQDYLIELKDSGPSYGYLYSVAKQMIVTK